MSDAATCPHRLRAALTPATISAGFLAVLVQSYPKVAFGRSTGGPGVELRILRASATGATLHLIWTDAAGAQPAAQLKDMLESLGCRGHNLGIETKSYGLIHFNGKAVDATLDGFCTLKEATDLIDRLRLVKSPAELKYVRKAGELGDAALKAAIPEVNVKARRIVLDAEKLAEVAFFED